MTDIKRITYLGDNGTEAIIAKIKDNFQTKKIESDYTTGSITLNEVNVASDFIPCKTYLEIVNNPLQSLIVAFYTNNDFTTVINQKTITTKSTIINVFEEYPNAKYFVFVSMTNLGEIDYRTYNNKINGTIECLITESQEHINTTNGNPHNVTKANVGLGNVDNTADSDKEVLSATKLTTARKINGVEFDGTKDIVISEEDTGWIDVTRYNANFTYYSENEKLQVRRIGKEVHLRGVLTPAYTESNMPNFNTNGLYAFALPSEDFIPAKEEFILQQGDSVATYSLRTGDNGSDLVRVTRYNNGTSETVPPVGAKLYVSATWFVD